MILTNRHAFVEAVAGRSGVCGSILDLHFPDGNGLFQIEARDLAGLMRKRELEVLKMRHVDLRGDLALFLRALKEQKKLRSFQAEFCNFSFRIAPVLAALPALETLNIVGHKGMRWRRPIPADLVIQLLQKGALRDLRVDRMGNWNPQTAEEFFQTLMKGDSKVEVFWCLSSNWGDTDLQLLAQVIQQSHTITDIRISVTPQTPKLQPLAASLQHNRTLTNLGIRLAGEEDPSPSVLQPFLDVLQTHNSTLQDLVIARGTRWDPDQRRHIPLFIDQAASAVYRKMDFYLSLNRAGRASLLQDNATAQQLLQVIACQWNLSLVYYFLRWNPTCFLTGVPPPCAKTRAQERAALLQRFTVIFPETLRQQTLTLVGPRQIQDALVCLPVLSFRQHSTILIDTLSIRFVERGLLLSWRHLASLLECLGPCLRTLSLEGLILDGLQHYNDFEKQLTQRQQLRHFSIQQSKVLGWNCDSMATVLSGMNQLESLEWIGNQGVFWKLSHVSNLLQKRPIKFLSLDSLQEENNSWNQFLDRIQQAASLRIFRCELEGGGFSGTHLEGLGRVLAANNSIENLRIQVQPQADLKPLAEALRTNRSLTGLHVTGLLQTPMPDLSAFSAVLETSNSTLRSLIVGTCDLSNMSSNTHSGKHQRIGVLLQSNIARSRPPPLLKPCYNPS